LIGRNVTGMRGDAANLDDLASAGWGEDVKLGEITERTLSAIASINLQSGFALHRPQRVEDAKVWSDYLRGEQVLHEVIW
jgi:hypothetical protein